MDEDILKIVEKNNFEKASDKMVAYLETKKLPQLLHLLQEKFNDSVKLTMHQFSLVKGSGAEHKERHAIKLLTPEEVQEQVNLQTEIEIAEAELELELELLRLKHAA